MASRRICNPPSKNVRPIKPGGFVIPQQKEKHTPLLRISNPQSLKRLGHFLTPDFKSGGTPSFAADFKSGGTPKSPVRLLPCTNGHLLKGKGRSKFLAARPERAEAPSPGQHPGLDNNQQSRPVRAKALYIAMYFKAFALTGRLVCAIRLPRALPWAKSFCPYRACCQKLASALYLCFTLRPAIFNSLRPAIFNFLRPVTVGSGRQSCGIFCPY